MAIQPDGKNLIAGERYSGDVGGTPFGEWSDTINPAVSDERRVGEAFIFRPPLFSSLL